MIIVSDITPLISLLKIKHLDVLQAMYGSVLIPPAVFSELTANDTFADEAEEIRNCDFLEVREIADYEKVRALQRETGLDLGETEAIVLAGDTNASLLLIDEVKGRTVARSRGFSIAGALGVLTAAYAKNLISAEEIRAAVDVLRSSGRHISEELLARLLELL